MVGGDPDGDGRDGILFISESSVAYVNYVQEGVDGLLALDGSISLDKVNPEDSIVFFEDWDGNGTDTVGQYRGSETLVILRNTSTEGNLRLLDPGPIDIRYQWGQDGMTPLAGTWR